MLSNLRVTSTSGYIAEIEMSGDRASLIEHIFSQSELVKIEALESFIHTDFSVMRKGEFFCVVSEKHNYTGSYHDSKIEAANEKIVAIRKHEKVLWTAIKYELVTGFDEFQNREIYRVESADESYIGKWHYLKEDAEEEKEELEVDNVTGKIIQTIRVYTPKREWVTKAEGTKDEIINHFITSDPKARVTKIQSVEPSRFHSFSIERKIYRDYREIYRVVGDNYKGKWSRLKMRVEDELKELERKHEVILWEVERKSFMGGK